MNPAPTPQVAIFIESSKTFGREILQRISTCARTLGPWLIYIDEWGPQTVLPEKINSWQGDGVIARLLLIDTDFTLGQIAQMAGYSSAAYLSVVIKEHENCTPTEFRQKP
ncbi:helix-turn-helix domain-containing protein [Gimesia sp.]|uniref:helix-turn-helix domain-containing protein n=1 Tax=Gimesia sp. TaxID=2024833 RepID=UPI000C4B7A9B|nr:helix-turn-helix domain-containing protein [Gimesia sp.]MAX39228.1 hypothetical protein [Gimesia sp.]HAH47948.1 hypothetical protein [Planctomycetaceae bacterium]HBL48453.1 hypothetical protein [Planctomycetaceae bacterium]|tara:strand:+ start:18842 stop:19171 length:330 start_codon:yes stop_codon:yes gene_type:complete